MQELNLHQTHQIADASSPLNVMPPNPPFAVSLVLILVIFMIWRHPRLRTFMKRRNQTRRMLKYLRQVILLEHMLQISSRKL